MVVQVGLPQRGQGATTPAVVLAVVHAVVGQVARHDPREQREHGSLHFMAHRNITPGHGALGVVPSMAGCMLW